MFTHQVLIYGLGASNLAVVHYLAQKCQLVILEENPANKNLKLVQNIANVSVFNDKALLTTKFKTIIVTPGIDLVKAKVDTLLLADGGKIINDIELFAQITTQPIIAITGSNGKSTVTTLVGLMLAASGFKVAVGGNLGPAVFSLPPSDCYVLELSSFQLELVASLKPYVATILNISPDHLDRHQSMEAYLAAKARIYQGAKHIVKNLHATEIEPYLQDKATINFSLSPPSANCQVGIKDNWLYLGETPIIALDSLKIHGEHNVLNALAAIAIGHQAGASKDAMAKVLMEFTGLEHRAQVVAYKNDVVWINDSKGTNVGATLATFNGLKHLASSWIIILGGSGKGSDFAPLQAIMHDVTVAILIGQEQALLYQTLAQYTNCIKAQDLKEAVAIAYQLATPKMGVLLSPACASYDMYNNFMERGEHFKELVTCL